MKNKFAFFLVFFLLALLSSGAMADYRFINDSIDSPSQVDQWVFNLSEATDLIIDVQAWEACGSKPAIPQDFFGDGNHNNRLHANIYLFTSTGTLISDATGIYSGDSAPGSHDTRSGQNAYLGLTGLTAGDYILAIGAYELSQTDAWAGFNTQGTDWTDYDEWENIQLYNYYNIIFSTASGIITFFLPPPIATDASNLQSTSFSANWNSASGATEYELDVALDSSFHNIVSGYNSLNVDNVTTYPVINNIFPNTQYFYRIKAFNSYGESSSSNTINVITLANNPNASTFSNIALDSIKANWGANGNPSGTEYLCEVNIHGVTVDSGWTTSTSWLCTGLSCGTIYSFWVKARNGENIETTSISLGSQNTLNCEYPNIAISPVSLSSSCPLGTNAPSQSFNVWNSGTGMLDYSISDDVAWLTCSPAGGSSSGGINTHIVNYSTSGLASGNYSATITISASGVTNSPQAIAVDFYVATMGPTANAGPDQYIDEGETVMLDASNSNDPDDGIVSYQWEQISGTTIMLSGATLTAPTFVTPPVDSAGIVLEFQLTITDASGLTDSDNVSITVNDNGIMDFPADVLPVKTSTGQSIGIKQESGGTLISLNVVNPSTIPDSIEKPSNLIYGLIDMQIKVEPSGTTSLIVIYLPSPAPDDFTWYKYRSVYGWVDYSQFISFNTARDQITMTLVDGGIGDDDAMVDGTIIDPSGLGTSHETSSFPENDEEGALGGCFIGILIKD